MGLTGNKRSSWVARHSAAWFAFDLTLLAQLWPRRNRAVLRNIKLLFKISLSRYCDRLDRHRIFINGSCTSDFLAIVWIPRALNELIWKANY